MNRRLITITIGLGIASLCLLSGCGTVREGIAEGRDRLAGSAGFRLTGEELQFYIAWRQLFRSDQEVIESDGPDGAAFLIEPLAEK